MKTLSPDNRKSAAHRLAIVDGHLRKVRQMVDQDENCIDIIHQSRAIQQALRKFDEQIMDQHVRICLTRDMKDRNIEEVTKEFLSAFVYRH